MDLHWPPIDDDDARGRQQREGQREGGLDHALSRRSRRNTTANLHGTMLNARNILRELLPEILDRILAFLDPVDLRRLRLCCKWLRSVSYRHITRLRVTDPAEDDLAELYRRLTVLTHLTHLTISASSLRILSPIFIGYSLPARIFPILRNLVISLESSAAEPLPYLLSALRKATALTSLHMSTCYGGGPGWSALLSSCPGLHALTLHGVASTNPAGMAAPICACTALRRLELSEGAWEVFWRSAGKQAFQLPPLISDIRNFSFRGPSGDMSRGDADDVVRALAQLPLEKLHVVASPMDSMLSSVLRLGRLVELRVDCTRHCSPPWLRGGCPLIPALPSLTGLQALKVQCPRCPRPSDARYVWREFCAAISHASALTRLELKATGLLSVWTDCLRPEHLIGVSLPQLVKLAVPLITIPVLPPEVDLWRLLAEGMPALRNLSLAFVHPRDYGRVVGCGSGLTRLTSLTVQVADGHWSSRSELSLRMEAAALLSGGLVPPVLTSVDWPTADFAISNTGLQSAFLVLGMAHVERDVRRLAKLARKCHLHARIMLNYAFSTVRQVGTFDIYKMHAGLGPGQKFLAAVWERDLALEELPGLLRRLDAQTDAPWTLQLVPRTAETEEEFGVLRDSLESAMQQPYATWIPVRVGIQRAAQARSHARSGS